MREPQHYYLDRIFGNTFFHILTKIVYPKSGEEKKWIYFIRLQKVIEIVDLS